MNIFFLDSNLTKCAQAHCDKHVVKMVLESVQLLSSVLHHFNLPAPYKETHKNHPCAKWARQHNGNYTMLWDLANELGIEYTYRYGKVHKSHKLLLDEIPREIDTGEASIFHSPLPNCTDFESMPEHYNLVDLYRLYYIHSKSNILSYNKGRKEPDWMGDRFYQQRDGKTCGSLPPLPRRKTTTAVSSKPATSRVTKDDIVAKLECKALKKLLLADLQKLAVTGLTDLSALSMPTGRLKKPFVDAAKNISDSVDWNKLTVAELKEVLTTCNIQ